VPPVEHHRPEIRRDRFDFAARVRKIAPRWSNGAEIAQNHRHLGALAAKIKGLYNLSIAQNTHLWGFIH